MMNDYGCGKGGLDNSGYKEIRPIYGNKGCCMRKNNALLCFQKSCRIYLLRNS